MESPRFSGGTWTRGEVANTGRPSMRISPDSGCSSPAMARSVVVSPQPDGPEQGEVLARRDGEGDAAHRGDLAVADDQVAHLDGSLVSHRRRAHPTRPGAAWRGGPP